MDHPIRRFAVPVVSFCFWFALQISGFHSAKLAWAVLVFGALWALVAAATWPSVTKQFARIPFRVVRQGRYVAPAKPRSRTMIERYGVIWVHGGYYNTGGITIGVHCPKHPDVSLLFRETGVWEHVRQLHRDDYPHTKERQGGGWLYCSGTDNDPPHDVPLISERNSLDQIFLEMERAMSAKLSKEEAEDRA